MKSSTLIIGLGKSGIAAAKLLNAEGIKVTILEKRQTKDLSTIAKELINEGIEVKLNQPLELSTFDPWLANLKRVIVSPGISWQDRTLEQLRALKVEVLGEISIAWERMNYLPWIGVTGTNGKTTVTEMLTHVLKTNALNTFKGGNIGHPASEIALSIKNSTHHKPDWLVMELSSYQIETAPEIKPKIGIWTNLSSDHLERHKSIENYAKIKQSLLDNSQTRIFNADDPYLTSQRTHLKQGLWISTKGPGSVEQPSHYWINQEGLVIQGKTPLFHSSVLHIPGDHNLQNLLLVTAAAISAGLSGESIKKSFSSFKGLRHRLEEIGTLHGMNIYNDSKATNYAASIIGLKAIQAPSIVIAGGQSKKGDPYDWVKQIQVSASGVVLFGSSAKELQKAILSEGFKGKIKSCDCLNNALNQAIKFGINTQAKSIILSPACASFDQYINYEERGEHFKSLVSKLEEEIK